MGIAELIALSMGMAWASGINLYATLAVLGIMGATGNMMLPPELQVVAHPAVIGAACLMYVIEFFADKIPGVDTGWDTIHAFIRIPAGALGDISPAAQVAALIIGGGISATSHGVKAGSRVLINASPEPFSNWAASTTEDVVWSAGCGRPFITRWFSSASSGCSSSWRPGCCPSCGAASASCSEGWTTPSPSANRCGHPPSRCSDRTRCRLPEAAATNR